MQQRNISHLTVKHRFSNNVTVVSYLPVIVKYQCLHMQRFDWQTIMLINIHNIYILHHSDDVHSDLHILCIRSSCKMIYDGRAPSLWHIMWLLSVIIHREEVGRWSALCACVSAFSPVSGMNCRHSTFSANQGHVKFLLYLSRQHFCGCQARNYFFDATLRPLFGYCISWIRDHRIIFFWSLILGDKMRCF